MPELRTETMTVNMGPQHPSTHGVLRLVLELDGETVVGADATIGYLHTGIEKTTEQKKWQQVIPLVERMDYLSAQSNSLGFALSVEQLLGLEMPERVQVDPRAARRAAADQQPPGLARHARDGARRRLGDALLLPRARAAAEHQRADRRLPDVPELHPGRRPARGPAARASTRRCTQFLDRLPGEARRVRGPADEEPDLPASARAASASSPRRTRSAWAWSGPIARAAGVDLRRAQGLPVLRLRDVRLRRADRHATATSTTATSCAIEEMRQSVRICRQALERITPTGACAVDDPRIVPPPKDKVYTEMEALIQHFLIYSQGFTVPAGEAYVPVEGPRGEHGCYVVSDGTNRPWRVKMRSPSLLACQALPKMIVGGHDRRRHRRHRLDRRRHGRRGPVSFHPEMPYESGLHASQRDAAATRASRSPSRRSNRARLERDRQRTTRPSTGGRRSSPRCTSCRSSRATSRASAMRHVAEVIGCTPAEVEDVVSYYAMFFRKPVGQVRAAGVPDAVVRAARRRARDRGAVASTLGIKVGRDRPDRACSRCMEVECLGACDRAPVVMVNNEHWHECQTPEDAGELLEAHARRRARRR